jgi:hypothetical protein
MTAKPRFMLRTLWTLLVVATGLPAQTSADSATFRGTVLDQTGAPVEAAVVTYTRLLHYAIKADAPLGLGQFWQGPRLPAPGEVPFSGAVTTNSGGTFEAAVPPGDYLVCIAGASGRYVDPCLWTSPIQVSSLSRGEVRDVAAISLKPAALVSVHVSDPEELLGAELGPLTLDPGILVGVQRDDGAFYRAWPLARTASGRDFQILVPPKISLQLWVFSRTLRVANSEGRTLSGQGEALPFEAVEGQETHIDLSVQGK